jgi:dihydroflavonol-4-reductase
MRAAHKHKVKRVVITSSVAAIFGPLAEKAAWEFLHALPEAEKFELVIINPVLILGPSLIPGDFTSGAIIQKLMSGAYPGMPKVQFAIVDVREVAIAHL